MFSSPKPEVINKKNTHNSLSEIAVNNFIKISWKSLLDSLIVSGGGEPMLEMPTIINLIKNAHFSYFEVITSAYWTANINLMKKILSSLQNAITLKKNKGFSFEFCLRISVDKYHQKVVKYSWLKNLVDVLRDDALLPICKRKYPDIKIFFRALLIEDDTIDKIAEILEAELSPMKIM